MSGILDIFRPGAASRVKNPLNQGDNFEDEYGICCEAVRMPVERFADTIGKFYKYWCEQCGDRAAPRRSDFDPIDVPSLLSSIILWDVSDGGEKIVCRVAGTRICEAAGRELRGMTVEEIHWDQPDLVKTEFLEVVESGHLHYVDRSLKWIEKSFRSYERLLAPLTDEDGTVVNLISVIHLRRN